MLKTVLIFINILLAGHAHAVPPGFNVQGYLEGVNNNELTGNDFHVRFSIYDSPGEGELL